MNQHRYTNSEITQQNSTTQCGPLAAAGQNLPLIQFHKKFKTIKTKHFRHCEQNKDCDSIKIN